MLLTLSNLQALRVGSRCSKPHNTIRKRLLSQAHRGIKDHSRRPRPNRRPSLPILHQTRCADHPEHCSQRHLCVRLGTGTQREAPNRPPLCLRSAPQPRAGAYPSLNHGLHPHPASPLVPARADLTRASGGRQAAPTVFAFRSHAGNARCGIRGADAESVHDRSRERNPEPDLSGAG